MRSVIAPQPLSGPLIAWAAAQQGHSGKRPIALVVDFGLESRNPLGLPGLSRAPSSLRGRHRAVGTKSWLWRHSGAPKDEPSTSETRPAGSWLETRWRSPNGWRAPKGRRLPKAPTWPDARHYSVIRLSLCARLHRDDQNQRRSNALLSPWPAPLRLPWTVRVLQIPPDSPDLTSQGAQI